jgi:hypothetical protein
MLPQISTAFPPEAELAETYTALSPNPAADLTTAGPLDAPQNTSPMAESDSIASYEEGTGTGTHRQ